MLAVAAVLALASTAHADRTPEQRLAGLLAGRHAGPRRRCILPDFSAQPRIIDGQALVYWKGPETYVARFHGGCPQLRQDRIIVTDVKTGQLCVYDQVRVVEPTGSGFGFCTFESFTPYAK